MKAAGNSVPSLPFQISLGRAYSSWSHCKQLQIMSVLKKLLQEERGCDDSGETRRKVFSRQVRFGTPPEIKESHGTFTTGGLRKPCRTITGQATDPCNTNAAWKQSTLAQHFKTCLKSNISYYISIAHKILQFCNPLNAFSVLRKLDQAQEINTWKVSGLPCPLPCLYFPCFSSFFPSELATRILALAFSPRGYPDSWVCWSSSFQMLAHGDIVMKLQSSPFCALQPPYISVENKFTNQ